MFLQTGFYLPFATSGTLFSDVFWCLTQTNRSFLDNVWLFSILVRHRNKYFGIKLRVPRTQEKGRQNLGCTNNDIQHTVCVSLQASNTRYWSQQHWWHKKVELSAVFWLALLLHWIDLLSQTIVASELHAWVIFRTEKVWNIKCFRIVLWLEFKLKILDCGKWKIGRRERKSRVLF